MLGQLWLTRASRSVLIEDVRRATGVNHDPLHQCIGDAHRDHQFVIMVGVFNLSYLEGDLGFAGFVGAFPHNGPCLSLVSRRAVTFGRQAPDNNVDLLLNGPYSHGDEFRGLWI
ncbi:hypothetical protein B296_00010500 [Ensete ventricosum]|uniref:Uncharacterized protein n=1 Tax=Ensete ventricosum TaxID=4639 RepID=A0A427BA00_ENSVE|nr:hypothetical protein B296_00010500 [Ensete ventricosum]